MTVAIGIFSVLLLGITYMVYASYKYYDTIMNQTDITSNLQKNMNLMSKEIREMRQADSGSYALGEATNAEILFYSNIDNTSDVERIRYKKDGTCLKKGVTKPSGSPLAYLDANETFSTLTCNLDNATSEPVFAFYSGYPSSSTLLPDPVVPRSVKIIKISLRIKSPSIKNAPTSKIINFYVTPRNINQAQ